MIIHCAYCGQPAHGFACIDCADLLPLDDCTGWAIRRWRDRDTTATEPKRLQPPPTISLALLRRARERTLAAERGSEVAAR